MVFQDYELIPTKRVNNDRRSQKSIFLNRLFLAGGGWSSTYIGFITSYMWLTKQTMEGVRFPMNRYLLAAPVFFAGFMGGVFTIGDKSEFFHLLKKYPTYRKEFKMIRSELYYN